MFSIGNASVKEKKLDNRFENLKYWNTFNPQHWYDAVKEHTFQTSILPISIEEASAITKLQLELITKDTSDPNVSVDYQDNTLKKRLKKRSRGM